MNEKQSWWIVAAVALLVQAAFIGESHRHLAFQIPIVDAATYHNTAVSLARGEAPPREAFWQPPLYPILLGVLYRISGENVLFARAVQGVSGVLSALLVFAIASRMTSRSMALVAALLTSIYGPLLFYHTQLLPTGLAVTLNLLAILLTLRLLEKPGIRRALCCGLAFGSAALAVPNALVGAVIPVACIFLMPGRSPTPRERLRLTGAMVLAIVLCILPVSIRNRSVSGAWVPISTNGGINLFIGNNPEIDRTMTIRPGLDWDRLTASPFREGASSAAEAQEFFFREVRSHIREAPGTYLKHLMLKALYLVQAREIPRNTSIYAFREHTSVLGALVWKCGSFAFPFGIVGALGIAGLIIASRTHRERRVLAAFMLVYAASVVFFFPAARYRAPMIPGLLIFAVLAACTIIQQIRTHAPGRWRNLAILLVATTLVNLPIRLPANESRFESELQLYLGVGLQVRGRSDEALEAYDSLIEQDPSLADAFYYRGSLHRDLGRNTEAIADFDRAIQLRPDHEIAIHDLAVLLFEEGHVDVSVELLQRALRINDRYTRAMKNLGIGLVKQGKYEEGARWILEAQSQGRSTRD